MLKMKSRKKHQMSTYQKVHNFLYSYYEMLYNYEHIPAISIIILFLEVPLNIFVINRVKYTEIDWKAYMQEVEGFLNGTTDYSLLKGDTGPLVYPAGFVYIFSLFYAITNKGENIRLAQYLYIGLYIVTLYLLFRIYNITKKVPPYVLIISCCISYRVHSIYVLRLFNDPVAMLLLYVSLNLFLSNKWTLGSIFYSLAVSVKMNILLYSPALLMAYIIIFGIKATIKQLAICAFVQLLLGFPFLIKNPNAYVTQSFNLGRVFMHKWTVNWRFLPETIFVNTYFHICLLLCHFVILICFLFSWHSYFKSFASFRNNKKIIKTQLKTHKKKVNMNTVSRLLLLPLFICNFIGIVCSRSLHYQFYIWYYHTLPYLLWSTPYSNKVRLTILGIIELCWNTYPSTNLSSMFLHISHCLILYGLFSNRYIQHN